MPVGLIVQYTPAQPDHPLDAQIGAQLRLDRGFIERRIAVAIEQTLLRHQSRARTVGMNRAALIHERRSVALATFDFQHLAGDQIVLVPGEIQSALQSPPSVEPPVHASHRATRVDDESRADVSHPAVVVRHLDDANRFRQQCPGVVEMLRGNTNTDRLELADGGRDRDERLLRGPGHLTPIVGALGPQHPAAAVRLELARHPEPVGRWSGGERQSHFFR